MMDGKPVINIRSYGKIEQAKRGEIEPGSIVRVEEKLDGSQTGFLEYDGKLYARSRGGMMDMLMPQNLFKPTIAHMSQQELKSAFVYYGEAMKSERQNKIKYNRAPDGHLMLFDVLDWWNRLWLSHDELCEEAGRIGVEPAPILFLGTYKDAIEQIPQILENAESFCGGKIEGVVIKENKQTLDRQMVKIVSERFKETQAENLRKKVNKDSIEIQILESIQNTYGTKQRLDKAIQHLREEGKLTDSNKDIGPLIKEFWADLVEEEKEEIKEFLWLMLDKQIRKTVTNFIPGKYQKILFGEDDDI